MNKITIQVTLLAATLLLVASCKGKDQSGEPSASTTGAASGDGSIIAIDGSSTVYPITEAVAEEFRDTSHARVTIGVSGTGGGFKKFCHKETVIANASRPIKTSEVAMCKKSGVEYIELPIAYDGIAVVVSAKNNWVAHMTVDELKALWQPEAQNKVQKWSEVRTGWPDKEIHLFGPGVDSGTYDYFTAAIVGKEHASRGDFTSSEDDNVLVKGISSDDLALGFFGVAYYEENRRTLKLVPVDDGKANNGVGPIAPTTETITNATYQPLARPIFIYVSKDAAARPEVKSFVTFYLQNAAKLSAEVGYVALPARAYELAMKRFDSGVAGSLFAESAGSNIGVSIEEILAHE